ncbi:MAG: serine hydrolase [Lawsonibacter sp.]|nr:serine hydrolase [Lawsonibacter sp.]
MKQIPQQAIYQLLAQLKGTVGLYIHVLDTDEVFQINPGHVFPSASVIKIPMLALLLKDAAEGRVDWEARRAIDPKNRVGGTGILFELDQDYQPSIAALARLMIVLSDNTATNEIMDIIGIERMNQFCRDMGYENITLMRKMLDFEAIKQGRNNYMCAGEAGRLLVEIARGSFVSPEISQRIVDIMEHQQCRNKLPALLPAVPSYAPEEDKKNLKPGSLLVANKTGDLFGIQHDVGIFTLPDGRRYVISMFTGDLESDAQGIQTVAQVSRLVYDALK